MGSNLENFIKAEVRYGNMIYFFRCSDCGCEFRVGSLNNIKGLCSDCQRKRLAETKKKRIENETKKVIASALPKIRKRIEGIKDNAQINGKEYILKSEVLRIIDEMVAADE